MEPCHANTTNSLHNIYFLSSLPAELGFYPGQQCAQLKMLTLDFTGGLVVENPSANARDVGLIPGPGIFHMLWDN